MVYLRSRYMNTTCDVFDSQADLPAIEACQREANDPYCWPPNGTRVCVPAFDVPFHWPAAYYKPSASLSLKFNQPYDGSKGRMLPRAASNTSLSMSGPVYTAAKLISGSIHERILAITILERETIFDSFKDTVHQGPTLILVNPYATTTTTSSATSTATARPAPAMSSGTITGICFGVLIGSILLGMLLYSCCGGCCCAGRSEDRRVRRQQALREQHEHEAAEKARRRAAATAATATATAMISASIAQDRAEAVCYAAAVAAAAAAAADTNDITPVGPEPVDPPPYDAVQPPKYTP